MVEGGEREDDFKAELSNGQMIGNVNRRGNTEGEGEEFNLGKVKSGMLISQGGFWIYMVLVFRCKFWHSWHRNDSIQVGHPKETVRREQRRGSRVDFQGILASTVRLEEQEPADAAENSAGKPGEAGQDQGVLIWRPRKDVTMMEE